MLMPVARTVILREHLFKKNYNLQTKQSWGYDIKCTYDNIMYVFFIISSSAVWDSMSEMEFNKLLIRGKWCDLSGQELAVFLQVKLH